MDIKGANGFEALKALMGTLPGGPEAEAAEEPAETRLSGTQTLTLHYERKGRGGKEATIIVCPDSMSDAQTADLGAAQCARQRNSAAGRPTRGPAQTPRRNGLPRQGVNIN